MKSLNWRGAVEQKQFEVIGRRVIDNYFSHPAYYRIDGKPCFSIYDLRAILTGLGGVDAARRALDWLRNETVKAGFPGFDVQSTMHCKVQVTLSGVDGAVLFF